MDGPGRPGGAPPARAPGRARTPALRNAGPGLLHLRLHEGREPLRSLRPRPVAQRGARPHQGLDGFARPRPASIRWAVRARPGADAYRNGLASDLASDVPPRKLIQRECPSSRRWSAEGELDG